MTIESDLRSSKKKVKLSDDDNIEDTDKQIPFPKFDVCETVLARDKDGLLYEAVVRRSLWGVQQHSQVTVGMSSHEEIEKFIEQERFPTWHYFVHYNKWKSNWDRWVGQEDLLPLTPENQKVAEEIRGAHRALLSEMKAKKGKKVDGGAFLKAWKVKLQDLRGNCSSTENVKPKISRRTWQRDMSLRRRNLWTTSSNPSNYVTLPFGLKKVLVEDWEIVNHFKMVHRLPPSITVGRVLNLYMKSKGFEDDVVWFVHDSGKPKITRFPSTDIDQSLLNEWFDVAAGIALLFEQALPFRLLYPSENSQFAVMDSLETYKDKPKIELYGCEFLLRLFCQLPAIARDTSVAEQDIAKVVSAKLNDFVRYLNKNQSTFFAQSYRRHNNLELGYEKKIERRETVKRKVSHPPE